MLNEIAIGLISGFIFAVITFIILGAKKFKRPLLVMGNIFLIVSVSIAILWKQLLGLSLIGVNIPINYQISAVGILIFCTLNYCYMQLYGFIEMSITFRMLRHMLEAKDQTMTVDEMNQVYPFSEIIERKLRDGIKMGLFQMIEVGGEPGYLLAPKGLFMASILNWFRKLLKMEATG